MTLGSNTSGHLFDTSFNANGVLYSAASGVITSTTVGTATHVLTSNGAGVAPTFQVLPAGNITGPGSSTDRAIATWNGTGGTALFNNSTTNIDSTGRYTNSVQPCFNAYLSANVTNVTGDGTTYTIAFDSEAFDNNSNFNTSTGTFTAPVTGKYLLCGVIYTSGYLVGHNRCECALVTTGTTYFIGNQKNPFSVTTLAFSFCAIVSLSATNTATVTVNVGGSTKDVDVNGTAGYTTFSGYLLT